MSNGLALPGVRQLRRLLNYLFTQPIEEIFFLEEIQNIQAEMETADWEWKLELFRKAIYGRRNLQHIGLFEFLVGLIFMHQGRFPTAARHFNRAYRQWSFLKERPHVCLAQFAEGLNHQLSGRHEEALTLYMKVESLLARIRRDLPEPALILPTANYRVFAEDLNNQLRKAEASLRRMLVIAPPPLVANGLQSQNGVSPEQSQPADSPAGSDRLPGEQQPDSSPLPIQSPNLPLNQPILESDLDRLKALRDQPLSAPVANYLGLIIDLSESFSTAEEKLYHDLFRRRRWKRRGRRSEVNGPRLLRLLDGYFRTIELKTLCFDLKISYDWLPGQDKVAKVKALIEFCEETGRLQDLVESAARRRPAVPFQETLSALPVEEE